MSDIKPSNKNYFIGLMSGTSLDGIDTVICEINSPADFSLLHAQTFSIPLKLKNSLLALSQTQQLNELDLYAQLDVQMGQLFAQCCLDILAKYSLNSTKIHAIGSHGQTLRHYPETPFPTTLQIGDPNIIAQRTGITTIADFRRRDMAAGGQGAPLVPPFHHAIFKEKNSNKNKVILNIGGIANITFLPAHSDNIIGYDTGPGNGLMDDWCLQHFNCAYDNSGQLASQGLLNIELLKIMQGDPFFSQKAPKSTGREIFSSQWITNALNKYSHIIEPINVLTTLLELTVQSISKEINSLDASIDEVLVCGGGAQNNYLMKRLSELMPESNIASTQKHGLHPDWVEASAFAWLAYQTLNGLKSNLPAVTGARDETILGAIWQA